MADLDTRHLQQLVDLLRRDPDQQAALRQLLADDASARLTDAVEALAQAQRQTEQGLSTLTERVDRLTERVDDLAQAQQRTEERVDDLAQAQQRTEERLTALTERVDALAEQMSSLTSRVDRIADALEGLTEQVSTLTGHVDWLRGDAIERRYRDQPYRYLFRVARKLVVLSGPELDDLLEDAVAQGTLTQDETGEIRDADAVMRGRRVDGPDEVYVVLEASVGVGLNDVERARARADLLARTGRDVLAVVGGTWVIPDARRAAPAFGVWQISNGRTVDPAA